MTPRTHADIVDDILDEVQRGWLHRLDEAKRAILATGTDHDRLCAQIACCVSTFTERYTPASVRAAVGDLDIERIAHDVAMHGDLAAAVERARSGAPIPPLREVFGEMSPEVAEVFERLFRTAAPTEAP